MTEQELWKAIALDNARRLREARERLREANTPPKGDRALEGKPEALAGVITTEPLPDNIVQMS